MSYLVLDHQEKWVPLQENESKVYFFPSGMSILFFSYRAAFLYPLVAAGLLDGEVLGFFWRF